MSFRLLIRSVACRPLSILLANESRLLYQRNEAVFKLRLFSLTAGARKIPSSSEVPKALPVSLERTPFKEGFGISCCQGKLKNNEDRYDNSTFFPGLSYFAVFDGHSGDFSSEFLRRQLSDILSNKVTTTDELVGNGSKIMRGAFERCESLLEKEIMSSNLDQKTKDHSGSTALAALIVNKSEILLAQTGDSRAVLCRGGEPICITVDHTPNNETETERIEKSGGWIDWDTKLVPYVNGILSMTRSFGNCLLRNAGVTHDPFVHHINLDIENDHFLVLCTDGVSDWISDPEIVSIASQFDDPNESAHELTCCARQYGSTDDATAFVIPLSAWTSKTTSNGRSDCNFLRSNTLKRD